MRVGWPGWSLEVSDSWSITDDEECLTLELSDQGALQASSARKRDGVVTEDELFFSKVEREGWGPARRTRCGEFDGIVYEYTSDDGAWCRWFLKNGATLLFVTYNGTAEAAQAERDAVMTVLNTARVEGCRDA